MANTELLLKCRIDGHVRDGSLQQLIHTTVFYERQLTAIDALTNWCRENATKPPPARLLYAAAGAARNLRERLVPIKEPAA